MRCRKNCLVSKGLIFFISTLLFCTLYPFLAPAMRCQQINCTGAPASLKQAQISPTYTLRTPIKYELEGQPITVLGVLTNLLQEASVLTLYQEFTGRDYGLTYALFTFSTHELPVDEHSTLILHWEVNGKANIDTHFVNSTCITVWIEHNNGSWIPTYSIKSDYNGIMYPYGWNQYQMQNPDENYIQNDQMRIRFNLSHSLTSNITWTQYLYLYYLALEVQKDTALTSIKPSRIELLTPGFASAGNLDALHQEDGECYIFKRVTNSEESGTIQFIVEYDLGYYGLDELLGFRFSHYDWVQISGVGTYSHKGQIYVMGSDDNAFLCYIRSKADYYFSTPDIQHATFLATGNWAVNQCLRLLYSIQYTFQGGPFTFLMNVDWGNLCIIRDAAPLVILHQVNNTVSMGGTLYLNLTCLEGKAPISEVRLDPWDALLGLSQGNYLYSQLLEAPGQFSLFITIQDADHDNFTFLLGTVEVVQALPEEFFYTGIVIFVLIILAISFWLKKRGSKGKVRKVLRTIKKDLELFG